MTDIIIPTASRHVSPVHDEQEDLDMDNRIEKLIGFGPLSVVINTNAEILKTQAVTKKDGDDHFLHVSGVGNDDNDTFVIRGNLLVKFDAKKTERLWVDGHLKAKEIILTSDARVKDNVLPLKGCLAKVLGLDAFSYSRSDWEEARVPENERYIGLIAQRVQEILPELVREDGRSDRLSISYPSLLAVLIEAIKDLYANLRNMQLDVY